MTLASAFCSLKEVRGGQFAICVFSLLNSEISYQSHSSSLKPLKCIKKEQLNLDLSAESLTTLPDICVKC